MIRMVISDIDGTLLKKGEITVKPEIKEVINKIISNGIVFAVASGRHTSEIDELFCGCEGMYTIASDGGCVKYRDEILYYNDISDSVIEKLEDREDYFFQCPRYVYYNGKNAQLTSVLKEKYGEKLKISDKAHKTVKIIKYGASYSETPFGTYEIYGDRTWREWIKNGTCKGKAVEFIQKRKDIKITETVAFGDNFNDMSMMRYAKQKICMEKSPQQLKMICGRANDDILSELEKIETGGKYE